MNYEPYKGYCLPFLTTCPSIDLDSAAGISKFERKLNRELDFAGRSLRCRKNPRSQLILEKTLRCKDVNFSVLALKGSGTALLCDTSIEGTIDGGKTFFPAKRLGNQYIYYPI